MPPVSPISEINPERKEVGMLRTTQPIMLPLLLTGEAMDTTMDPVIVWV